MFCSNADIGLHTRRSGGGGSEMVIEGLAALNANGVWISQDKKQLIGMELCGKALVFSVTSSMQYVTVLINCHQFVVVAGQLELFNYLQAIPKVMTWVTQVWDIPLNKNNKILS